MAFNTWFQITKETCIVCHPSERKYFVYDDVQSMIDKLVEFISEPSPDMGKFAELFMGIGMESCFKCHLVHLPAALTKFNWKNMEVASADTVNQ